MWPKTSVYIGADLMMRSATVCTADALRAHVDLTSLAELGLYEFLVSCIYVKHI